MDVKLPATKAAGLRPLIFGSARSRRSRDLPCCCEQGSGLTSQWFLACAPIKLPVAFPQNLDASPSKVEPTDQHREDSRPEKRRRTVTITQQWLSKQLLQPRISTNLMISFSKETLTRTHSRRPKETRMTPATNARSLATGLVSTRKYQSQRKPECPESSSIRTGSFITLSLYARRPILIPVQVDVTERNPCTTSTSQGSQTERQRSRGEMILAPNGGKMICQLIE